jgi:hypothetical protein
LGIFFLNEEKKMRSLFSLYRGSERYGKKKSWLSFWWMGGEKKKDEVSELEFFV